MWDLPGPGLEPMSLTLAGGFLTTAPPGKSYLNLFKDIHSISLCGCSLIYLANMSWVRSWVISNFIAFPTMMQ